MTSTIRTALLTTIASIRMGTQIRTRWQGISHQIEIFNCNTKMDMQVRAKDRVIGVTSILRAITLTSIILNLWTTEGTLTNNNSNSTWPNSSMLSSNMLNNSMPSSSTPSSSTLNSSMANSITDDWDFFNILIVKVWNSYIAYING